MSVEHQQQTGVGLSNGPITYTMRRHLAAISAPDPFSRFQNARINQER
jgi:hypothetical protein